MLREVLMANFRFKPEKRRHQDNARIASSVVSLDKVVGNANLKELYVRVSEDGQMHYVEDYETEALQAGRKYLYTVGRTNRLFGDSPSELINGCVKADDGTTKVFIAF